MTSEERNKRLAELEEMHLKHILIHVQHRDPDPRPFRTFADSWYAYHRSQSGADFVSKGLAPLWMNRGDLAYLPPRCRQVHALSLAAESVLDGAIPFEPLARDHCVPLKRVRLEIIKAEPATIDEIRELMLLWYRCAVITEKEHGALRGPIRADMPEEWASHGDVNDPESYLARYTAADIPMKVIC